VEVVVVVAEVVLGVAVYVWDIAVAVDFFEVSVVDLSDMVDVCTVLELTEVVLLPAKTINVMHSEDTAD